jgi:uncharacterized membrane protein
MRHAVAIDGRQGVVIRYNISKKHLLILVGLNHKYANETIVSNLYYDWSRRLTLFYVHCQCSCHLVTGSFNIVSVISIQPDIQKITFIRE